MTQRVWWMGALCCSASLMWVACGGDVQCGPDTVLVEGECVSIGGSGGGDAGAASPGGSSDAPTEEPPMESSSDAGTSSTGDGSDDGSGADAGSEEEESTGGRSGCDEGSGECDEWEAELVSTIAERQRDAGCDNELTEDERVDTVAERHAAYQADEDRLTAESPDGNLYQQIEDEGLAIEDGSGFFSTTTEGPADVVERWEDDEGVAETLARCHDFIGVGAATNESSGTTYVTLLKVVAE